MASAVVVLGWTYLIWNASISTIWPMFGIANQLLAAIALAIGSVILVKLQKARYLWVTLLPLTFVTVTTVSAAIQMITHHYWPKTATPFIINLNIALIVVISSSTFF